MCVHLQPSGPRDFSRVRASVRASCSSAESSVLRADEMSFKHISLDHGQTRILDTPGHFKLAIILFNLRDRCATHRGGHTQRVGLSRRTRRFHTCNCTIQTRANSVNGICLRPGRSNVFAGSTGDIKISRQRLGTTGRGVRLAHCGAAIAIPS